MTELLRPRAVTRRGLLKGASALAAGALILPGSMARAQAAPKRGGILRMGIGHGATSDGYDPGVLEHLYSQTFAAARHNQLTEIAADGTLVPEIAESWDSSDALTWVLPIRQGVTFHSGKA